ncbi:MAG TPA: ATPase, T2SS/T4P/T4SS family [Acidimicrobiales bacterium]|nr:ATPase, T2SS/T4P/T4SS family [Acidimicrobiales bacterium]
MSDTEAMRLLAGEHNLEFVDLDRYDVDQGTSVLLPGAVARRHRVVPIGRKFGAPIIAVSNPGDVVAMDTLRAVIGREFIPVVASIDQIESYLTRFYGNGSGSSSEGTEKLAKGSKATEGAAKGPPGVRASAVAVADRHSGAVPEEPAAAAGPVVPPPPATVPAPAATTPVAGEVRIAEPVSMVPDAESAVGDVVVGEAERLAAQLAASEADLAALAAVPADDVDHVPASSSPPAPDPDEVALTAELVEEAVAEYEQSEGHRVRDEEVDAELADLPPLARVLVHGERVSLADMRAVIEERDRTGQAIARILTSKGLVTEADLMWGMAEDMGLEFVDLDTHAVDFGATFPLPEATARHHNVIMIGYRDSCPVIAASNPTDVFAMDDLRTIIGRQFIVVVATRSQINAVIDKVYHQGGDATEVAATAASEFDDIGDEDLSNIAVVDDAPIVRYVNLLILQSLNERASDIHVEPTAENLRIRYRIDGVLHDMSTAPRAIAAAVTTRLKVMADMNIAEHRVPQDGRISISVGNRQIDLRMATLPTIYGEKVVMRVLDKTNVVLSFEDLGFDADMLENYASIYSKPYGTILVTGPTGSGKTTTLYATLAALNSSEKNIITVEDPVELRIKGINQVQLNVKAGLTFASALRSILRADPDIVFVGEIRDRETAMISVEAALTGHLVLATLHTNDSASTAMRLVEMGLEPYLVTSSLNAALAQRLARRLCPHCKEPFEATEGDIVTLGWSAEEIFANTPNPTLYRAVGCGACSKTGYRGRKALVELLIVTEEIERLIMEGGNVDSIHRLAVEQGMVTLRHSGLRRALEGETTLEEVLRVVA